MINQHKILPVAFAKMLLLVMRVVPPARDRPVVLSSMLLFWMFTTLPALFETEMPTPLFCVKREL